MKIIYVVFGFLELILKLFLFTLLGAMSLTLFWLFVYTSDNSEEWTKSILWEKL